MDVYRRLFAHYGPQGWWPGDGPLDVVVGAILTQAANWRNVELALGNLKAALPGSAWSLESLRQMSHAGLAALVRPSGYFNAKARKLQAFAQHVHQRHGGDLAKLLAQEAGPLRRELLSIHGIGPETADAILVYAAGRPSFVIDAYTRRTLGRLGLAPAAPTPGYDVLQRLFHLSLPADPALFNEYHALLDRHAKDRCCRRPRCPGCPLLELCSTGQGMQGSR
jgi:endonuclease-3 related protein